MIRTTTTMLAVGFFTLTGLSAMASPKAAHHQAKSPVVAQAEGAPADAAKPAKKAHKGKAAKGKDKAASGEAAAPAPADDKK